MIFYCANTKCKNWNNQYPSRSTDDGTCDLEEVQLDINGKCTNIEPKEGE